MSPMMIRYLETLSKKGTHGRGVSKVMTTLIEQGVRRAIEARYIELLDDTDDTEAN